MHRALLIAEIFRNILDCMNTNGDEGTIVSLAVTCRAFHESSLDVLWYEQLNLLPLVRCMPADLWQESFNVVSLRRTPESTDWDRFNFYASRVKRMGQCFHSSKTSRSQRISALTLDVEVIRSFNNYRPTFTFLPQLRHLLWSIWSQEMFPYLQAFLYGSKVITLDICIDDPPTNTHDGTFALSVFSSLPRLCPTIEYLDLMPDTPIASVAASDLVCQLKHLRKFHSNSLLTATALTHLAGLCNLQRIWLLNIVPLDMSIDYLAEMRLEHPFASLRELVVDEWNVASCIALVKPLFMTCPLKSLELCFAISPPLPQFHLLLSILCSARWTASLKTLRLETTSELQDAPDSSRLPMADITPLFAMKNMEVLVVLLHCPYDLDDDFMKNASLSWPNLHRLDLRDLCNSDADISKVSMDGVLSLVQGCPGLTSIGVTVNMRTENLGPRPSCYPNVTEFLVGESTLDDSVLVFEYLWNTFPNLDSQLAWNVEENPQRTLWLEVDNLWQRKNGEMLYITLE